MSFSIPSSGFSNPYTGAISYSHFSSSPQLDFSPVLSSQPWNNPIWATFPSFSQETPAVYKQQSSVYQQPLPVYQPTPTAYQQPPPPVYQQRTPNFVYRKGMGPGALPILLGLSLFTPAEPASGKLRVKYSWKQIDFAYPTPEAREEAIATGKFVQNNSLPLGIEVYNGRTFVTLPKWKPGIPVTLAVIPQGSDSSPLLQPYPNWNWHSEGNCNGLTSVFRLSIDACGRLWVLDSGVIDVLNTTTQLCPSQLVVFDLKTDKLLWRYRIPKNQLREGSLFTNIVTDIRNGQCDEAFAYMTDVFRYAIVVYNWKEDRSWRISHNLFYPDPIACKYTLDGITFRWTDGVFGMALSPLTDNGDRTLYYHPMSSFREFSVPTSILRNDTADDNPEEFKVVGEPRGTVNRHSSTSGMDRRGVLFYNLVTQNSIGCWDSQKPYKTSTQGSIGQDPEILNFPNDLKIDLEKRQNIWVLTNKLHKYLYTTLNPDEINFRILTAPVDLAVKGTVCDPNVHAIPVDKPQCLEDEL